jgi:hypothetical protein
LAVADGPILCLIASWGKPMRKHDGQQVTRLLLDFSCQPVWPEIEVTELGNNVVLANGLTDESIILLKKLLSLPFYCKTWPYENLSGMSLSDVAILYMQLVGGTP